ncbi:LCP family protein [Extibacter muris]|uniref:LCP family protein n=1 Tax=Extibacter muris TaxID=1796622 RepID=UPI001D080B83|nr:LCP family protein [Extibacter muris]MCB6203640.1 LCP family protein [Extibacter muris]MCQ4665194.1 LCP family protein [Extibacter muris]MCQ4694608.1 LCP family protein [Extibacter muris]
MAKNKKSLKAEKAIKAKRKKKQRRRRRAVVLVVEVIMLLLLSGVAYAMMKFDKLQAVNIDKKDLELNEGVEEKEGYTTIALFGGDSRDGQLEEGTHADTIIVASINNKTKEIRLASIYRDTLLQQKNMGYNKANHAYFAGGPAESISMLNKNLDLDIQDYVTVDFKALVDTIDLLDGLDIDIKQEEVQYMNEYLQETADVAGTDAEFINEPGEQHLDGTQAVTYARIRSTAGGDYTRTERQRLVIEKIFEKVMHTDLSTINKIIDTVFEQVSTSFSLKELIGLASDVTKYKLGENTGFPFDVEDGLTYQNAGSVVIALGLAENVKQLHEFLYPDEEAQDVSETVQNISDEISYLTGVVRPASLDRGKGSGDGDGSTGTGGNADGGYDSGTDGGDDFGTDGAGGTYGNTDGSGTYE